MSTRFTPSWELFDRNFQKGDAVIVVTIDNELCWGDVLRTTPEAVTLTQPHMQPRFLEWKSIHFVTHDGFPIRAIRAMRHESQSVLKKTSVLKKIRKEAKSYGITEVVFGEAL